jgi:UDP-glucose 4-epimerase
MRVMVTGGCGLVGSFIVRYLLDQGHEPVVYDLAIKLELLQDVQRDVVFCQGDMLDYADLIHAVQANGVQRIIHTASFLTPGSRRRPYAAIKTNIGGALNVYEVGRVAEVERVVFCSTGKVPKDAAVFAEHLDSGQYPFEADPYTHTKIVGELLAKDYRGRYGLPIYVARFCGQIYGPGSGFSGGSGQLFQPLVESAVRGEPYTLERTPYGVMDLMYARDVARGAALVALREGLTKWLYPIRSYSAHPVAEVAEVIRELVPGAQLNVPAAPRPGHRIEPDSRALAELGYAAEYDLRQGMGEYIEWLRTRRLPDWKN